MQAGNTAVQASGGLVVQGQVNTIRNLFSLMSVNQPHL